MKHVYSQTQHALHGYFQAALGLALLLAPWIGMTSSASHWPRWVVAAFGLFFVASSLVFTTLTVRDEGEHLLVAHGPLAVFSRRIPYGRISRVRRTDLHSNVFGQTVIVGGMFTPAGPPDEGRAWHVGGNEAVKLVLEDAPNLRIGTRDVDGLMKFLAGKIGAEEI